MELFKRFFKKKNGKNERLPNFNEEFTSELKPREGYVFHSDMFTVDSGYGRILSFFHSDGSDDNYVPFWGVNCIPDGLPAEVTVTIFEQVRRLTKSWIDSHLDLSEKLVKGDDKEANESGSIREKQNSEVNAGDLYTVIRELRNNASYLHVHKRMLVKAPTLEMLDEAVLKIENDYNDLFTNSLTLESYPGCQRTELANLFAKNDRKRGKGFHFTSTEYAGSYNLVTQGLSDPSGEYVGTMIGDVNNSVVLLDLDNFKRRVVIAHDQIHEVLDKTKLSDIWGFKLGLSALCNCKRAVHIILNSTNLENLGVQLNNITTKIDLQAGDVNMFEMFGEKVDELEIFSRQCEKLKLMVSEANPLTDHERTIVKATLEKIVTKFYVYRNMWVEDAKNNRDKIRIVGLPHDKYPTLKLFKAYLNVEEKASLQSNDSEYQHAVKVLSGLFASMLSTYGDLFNNITSSSIDGVAKSGRVIYDLSSVFNRSEGIAMAQLVNILGYAINNIGDGDVLVLHGVDKIRSQDVKDFITMNLDILERRGGRIVFVYNKPDKMIADKSFCRYETADYTVIGSMDETTLNDYEESLKVVVPPDLRRLIVEGSQGLCYVRRNFDNIVFVQDLILNRRKVTAPKRRKVGKG